MAGGQQITFTVLGHDKSGWQAQGSTGEMQVAVANAEALVASKKFPEARVDQTYFDTRNQRQVTSTIVTKGKAQRGTPAALWLFLALIAGAVSFVITYTVINERPPFL